MPGIQLLDPSEAPLGREYRCVALRVGNLRVYVYARRQWAGGACAYALAEKAREVVDRHGIFNSTWAAAPSQDDVLETLIENREFPWDKVTHAGMMDEYLRLSPSDPRSFRYYHNTHLWGRLLSKGRAIDPRVIRQIKGDAADPAGAVREYSLIVLDHPSHIVQGGYGEENGHIAFNDPPEARFHEPRLVIQRELALAAKQQQVNECHFRDITDVPPAITMTIPALTRFSIGPGQEHEVSYWSCIAVTRNKATATEKVVLGPVTEDVPATRLRELKDAALFLDLDSAHRLHGREGIDLTPIGYDPRRYPAEPEKD